MITQESLRIRLLLKPLAILFAIGIVSFLATPSRAQIIDNRLGNAFKDEMFFNQEFLWQNRIKSVTGVVSIKRPGRPIEQRPDVLVYRFNEVGLLAQLDKVSSVMNFIDSLHIEYKRNLKGELEEKSEVRKNGFVSTKFIYDKEGMLSRIDYGKSENVSNEKGHLEPGQSITINSETFTYDTSAIGSLKKNNYNNYGLLYSKEIISKNELGYIKSKEEELVMSGKTTTRTYSYNEHGWVSKVETKDNLGGKKKEEIFSYDPIGNLEKIELKENDVLLEEIDVLYTETMLIEAILRNDMQTKEIVITKYSYEFFK